MSEKSEDSNEIVAKPASCDSSNAEEAASDLTKAGSATGLSIESVSPAVASRAARSSKWSKLSGVNVANFKAIESLALDLADVTVLVGPNGGGKSSVLQAIHWAARAASYIPPKNTKEVISFDRLDYLPSSDPLRTAHKKELSSETGSKPSSVAFRFAGLGEPTATIKIWAARNKGGISVHIEGGQSVTPFKQREEFITAYIPGLAGLSERETILAQPLLRRQAASGDAGGVLRNVLFNLASRQPGEFDDAEAKKRMTRLNELVQGVHPHVFVEVSFDEREDINLRAVFRDARLSGLMRPLEAAATGILQVVQIFAYLIFFRPKLLLVDEPDAHLHPDKQERLIEQLESAAVEFSTQVIVTTHSPHIVRAASSAVNLVWIADGKEVPAEDDAIRKLLGWGGLDRKCIFFIEDEDDKPIRAILKQWPELFRQISICRCFGIDNLPRNKLLEGLIGDGGLITKAIVHRDRDFMTDAECKLWDELYDAKDTFTWCTTGVDAEAYFCQPEYLSILYGVDRTVAEAWIEAATKTISKAKDKFFEKRKVINYLLHRDGGSPSSEDLWTGGGGLTSAHVLGKRLIGALKPVIKMAGADSGLLDRFVIPGAIVIAPELKVIVERALSES